MASLSIFEQAQSKRIQHLLFLLNIHSIIINISKLDMTELNALVDKIIDNINKKYKRDTKITLFDVQNQFQILHKLVESIQRQLRDIRENYGLSQAESDSDNNSQVEQQVSILKKLKRLLKKWKKRNEQEKSIQPTKNNIQINIIDETLLRMKEIEDESRRKSQELLSNQRYLEVIEKSIKDIAKLIVQLQQLRTLDEFSMVSRAQKINKYFELIAKGINKQKEKEQLRRKQEERSKSVTPTKRAGNQKNLQSQNRDLKQKVERLTRSYKVLEKQNQLMKNGATVVRKGQANSQKDKVQLSELTIEIQMKKQEKLKIERQYNEKLKQLQTLTEKQKAINPRLEQKQQQLNKMQDQIQQAHFIIKNKSEIQKEVSVLKEQQQCLKLRVDSLIYQEKELSIKIRDQQINLQNLNEQKKSIEQLQQLCKQLQQKQRQLLRKIQDHQKHLQKVQQKVENMNKQISKKTNQMEELKKDKEQKIISYNKQIQSFEKKKKNLQQIILEANKQLNTAGKYKNLFVGQVIQNEKHRLFLANQFSKIYPSKCIAKTRLLFSFGLMAGLNPHNTVDGKAFYIVLMKMENRIEDEHYTIALYSENPLQKIGMNNGLGFIASLTNEQFFYLKRSSNNQRVTQYSDYYFIFGNSEIRWKFNSDILETNIGHNFRSFNTKQHKNSYVFTGSKEPTCKIVDYQIFQIEFFDR